MPYKEKAEKFLSIAHDFKLGELPTEKSHPDTIHLSEWAKRDLSTALDTFKNIELSLLSNCRDKLSYIEHMTKEVRDTFSRGGRVFLCGCGATGRLSLALETIWRKTQSEPERVISFMAGGDVALIHSIENFEDFPEYGERQLLELGFGENDLLISTTEGGETPFVIGATKAAARVSKRSPFFLYCNPDEVLSKVAKRSKEVIEDSNISKINLSVGEMALSGSTRMQASTILMLAVGISLFEKEETWLSSLEEVFKNTNFKNISKLIEKESSLYEHGDSVLYNSPKALAISVLTDTTERSPTFSLNSFESSSNTTDEYSLCYLSVKDTSVLSEAWFSLLEREPRTLEWKETIHLTGKTRISGFDISQKIKEQREKYISGKDHVFEINYKEGSIEFILDDVREEFNTEKLDLFGVHILLKVLLNTHSTLVMGRLNRYESNIMTWVRPSNNKLIDRSIRYIKILLEQESISKSYEEICYELFRQLEDSSRNEALVMKVLHSIKKRL